VRERFVWNSIDADERAQTLPGLGFGLEANLKQVVRAIPEIGPDVFVVLLVALDEVLGARPIAFLGEPSFHDKCPLLMRVFRFHDRFRAASNCQDEPAAGIPLIEFSIEVEPGCIGKGVKVVRLRPDLRRKGFEFAGIQIKVGSEPGKLIPKLVGGPESEAFQRYSKAGGPGPIHPDPKDLRPD
jgi:hypothetical protein